MITWYKKLDVYGKSFITNELICLLAFLSCVPFYFYELAEIPNGIIVSGSISSLLFLLYRFGRNSVGLGKTIAINIIRFTLVIGMLFVSVFLYYKLEIKLFNVFAVVSAFFASTIVFVLLSYLENKNEDSRSE